MALPDKCWLDRGEILSAKLGVTRNALEAAADQGLVRTSTFGGTRVFKRKYNREDVVKIFEEGIWNE